MKAISVSLSIRQILWLFAVFVSFEGIIFHMGSFLSFISFLRSGLLSMTLGEYIAYNWGIGNCLISMIVFPISIWGLKRAYKTDYMYKSKAGAEKVSGGVGNHDVQSSLLVSSDTRPSAHPASVPEKEGGKDER